MANSCTTGERERATDMRGEAKLGQRCWFAVGDQMHTTFKKHCPSLTQVNVSSLSFFRTHIPGQDGHGVLYFGFQAEGRGSAVGQHVY